MVLAGYDADKRQVLVADRDQAMHQVSLEDLAKARGSKFKPFPPRNALYSFDFSKKHLPQQEDVRKAIREVVKGMLKPPIKNLGVAGIRKAADRLIEWPKIMDARQVRLTCFNAYIFIDYTGGTGGGLFRYMYGRFLKEAAGIVRDDRLAEAGQEIHIIGDRWQEAAQALKQASEDAQLEKNLKQAADILRIISQEEETAWKRLHELVG